MDIWAPFKTIQLKHKFLPFLTDETKDTIKDRDKKCKEAKSKKTDIKLWNEYKTIRNKALTQIRNDEHNYNTNQMKSKNNWKTAKKLLNINQPQAPSMIKIDNNIITKPKEISDKMNDFFINKPKILKQKINKTNISPLTNFRKIVSNMNPKPRFSFKTLTMYELKEIVKIMQPSKALGTDTISMKTIKDCINEIDVVLLNIVNMSIANNTYPTQLNISKIMPHLKPEKNSIDMNSYRPISILNAIAKVIDTAMAIQIKDFLLLHNLIPYNHNGGLKGMSTTTTVIVLLDIWSKIIEQNKNAVVLQLDQTAAYDMVNHLILLEKFKILGFDKNAIHFMESYLNNRRQIVEIEGITSEIKEIGETSTIQGSVLAGLLYLIYTLFP